MNNNALAPRDITNELGDLFQRVDDSAVERLAAVLAAAPRVFLTGHGRSRLIAAAFAMRMMHLGIDVHLAGDVTTPAIENHGLLVAISSSGTTGSVLAHAATAREVGSTIVAITASPGAPLANAADGVVLIPIQDQSSSRTRQHAGSLFEQAVLILGDAVASHLMIQLGRTGDDLTGRHANLQ